MIKNRTASRALRLWLTVLTIAALLTGLMLRPLPNNGLLWSTISNYAHLPLFGLLSLALLAFFRLLPNITTRQSYLLTIIASFVLAAGSELLQILTPNRAAEFGDFINDMLGSLSFLMLYALFDPHLKHRPVRRHRKYRLGLIALIAICWLPAIIPVSHAIYLHWSRYAAFPELFIPDNNQLASFMTRTGSRYDFIRPIDTDDTHQAVMRWQTDTRSEWPFLRLQDIIHDWSGFRALRIRIEHTGTEPVRLQVRIDDRHYDGTSRHAVSRIFMLKPGSNILELPFAQSSTLDLRNIKHVWLALLKPEHEHTLLVHSIRLQPSST